MRASGSMALALLWSLWTPDPKVKQSISQRAQYPLIEEYLRFLDGLLKGIYRGSIRGLRNSGLKYIGFHIMIQAIP